MLSKVVKRKKSLNIKIIVWKAYNFNPFNLIPALCYLVSRIPIHKINTLANYKYVFVSFELKKTELELASIQKFDYRFQNNEIKLRIVVTWYDYKQLY